METIIVAAVAFVIGWVLGSFFMAIKQAQAFKSILNDLGVTTEQLLKLKQRLDLADDAPETPRENVVEVKLEQHSGMIYAFRKDNDQFLGQGTDREQLIKHLDHTFAKGARIIIRDEDGAELVKP